jgi:hypothetical protein
MNSKRLILAAAMSLALSLVGVIFILIAIINGRDA